MRIGVDNDLFPAVPLHQQHLVPDLAPGQDPPLTSEPKIPGSNFFLRPGCEPRFRIRGVEKVIHQQVFRFISPGCAEMQAAGPAAHPEQRRYTYTSRRR